MPTPANAGLQQDTGPVATATASAVEVLARLVADVPVDASGVAESDPLYDVVQRVAGATPGDRHTTLVAATRGVPGADDLMLTILSVDPTADLPPASVAKRLAIPELPKGARPDPTLAAGAGGWLDRYVAYADAISPMTPRSFHEADGLWLASTAIARRLYVPMSFGRVYPNLFIMLIAVTTLFHKTTAMDAARAIAQWKFPHLLASQDSTPEAFISDMAGLMPEPDGSPDLRERWARERDFAGQRSLILDEASGLYAAAGRDYNAGLIETLLRCYDCMPEYTRSTKGQGRATIRNASLSALMASTPRAMGPHLGSESLWAMGWWPRFGILTPDVARPPWKKPSRRAGSDLGPVADDLMVLYERLPVPTWPDGVEGLAVELADGVLATWDRYSKATSYDLLIAEKLDDRLHGTYGRLPTQIIKIATNLAALDWASTDRARPTIELRHLHRAIEIAETWRASVHRALDQSVTTADNVKLDRILRQISLAGLGGISMRDLGRKLRDVKPSELERLVEYAVKIGEVDKVSAPSGPKGGRPTDHYRIAIA